MKAKDFVKLVRWSARVLAILLVCFVSLFALDVFSESNWLLPLLVHLIPSYVLVAALAVAWRYETIGGYLFITCGLFLAFLTNFEATILYAPTLLLGSLFLLSGYLRLKQKP